MKPRPAPLVSVLLPVYNNLEYLGEAIKSILNQTVTDLECIILDDGSTEPVRQVIEAFTDQRIVRMRHPKNKGLPAALNSCLDAARGRYLARMDSDDVSSLTRLEEQLALFTGRIGLVSCWGYTIEADGKRIPNEQDPYLFERIRVTNEEIRRNITKGNLILGAASVFTRAVFDRIGYFDETLVLAEDYNYWLRILQHYDVAIVPKELYKRRQHSQNMSHWTTFSHDIDHAAISRERARTFPTIKYRLSDCREAATPIDPK